MRGVAVSPLVALGGPIPHPTPLRGATFSRNWEKEDPRSRTKIVADAKTLSDLIKAGADDATALSAPGGRPLTFRDLRALVAGTICELNGNGIARGDRVAIVLPNGPEMAAPSSRSPPAPPRRP